jgi:hypothetical protein
MVRLNAAAALIFDTGEAIQRVVLERDRVQMELFKRVSDSIYAMKKMLWTDRKTALPRQICHPLLFSQHL